MELDVAIIGCGPAGLSAAINAKIRKKTVKVFGTEVCSAKLESAPWVENYLGMQTTGTELGAMYLRHFTDMGLKIHRTRVDTIVSTGTGFMVAAKGEIYEARTIILATGISQTTYLPGERDFVGRGISYCGTCDGPLYTGKKVAVIGYTAEAVEEAKFLATIASLVYYIPQGTDMTGPHPNIEVVHGRPIGILGEVSLTRLALRDKELRVDGVFIFRETTPVEQILADLELSQGAVHVDRQMATNIPGVFAAGDCTGRPFQLAKAVGEGAVAGLSAAAYLDKRS
ncbi:MAG: Thioredoxin reductase [Firmicutes bacterium]|nr:Thioredoxin reductase [Bacillota bacterium]MBT9157553.1 Thioredoxin reductase [Bacillota bacterium]